MSNTKDEGYKEIYELAKSNSSVIGFFLGGSRGKTNDLLNPDSDYDMYLIVEDNGFLPIKKRFSCPDQEFKVLYKGNDLMFFSVSEFRAKAKWNIDSVYERYIFTHVKALIDKTGEIQPILDELGRIPKKEVKEYIEKSVDAYYNFYYRSIKCLKYGTYFGARWEANISIQCYYNLIFALHDGRIAPYGKYFLWEIEKAPLYKFSLTNKELEELLLEILNTANFSAQRRLFGLTEELLIKEGYEHAINFWDKPALEFMRRNSL